MDRTVYADQGFYFGMGAFETMALRHGSLQHLDLHLARLQRTLEFLKINRIVTEEMLMEYVQDCGRTEGVVKLVVTEKNMDLSTRDNTYTRERYEAGFDVCLAPWMRNESSPFTYHKTLNHAENIRAHQLALENKFDEAVFCNTKGELCEGSCSNLFLIKNGRLYTPALDCGMLPGTMRAFLMQQEDVCECHITPSELAEFEECFLTNSLMGIMRVNRIGEYVFSRGHIVQELQKKLVSKT